MTNYFSHDFSARNDIKLQKLVMEMGYEGLGFYWCIVEMLYEQNGKVELEQCTSIAFALHTNIEKINQLIDTVFEKDSKYFWSESVLKRLKVQKEISKVRKNAVKKRWSNEAKNSNTTLKTNEIQMNNKSNTIKRKEKKEKEIKIKEKSVYVPPQIFSDENFINGLKEKFPDKDIPLEIEKMKDWLASNGKKKDDYPAFARNWLRNENFTPKQQGQKIAVIT